MVPKGLKSFGTAEVKRDYLNIFVRIVNIFQKEVPGNILNHTGGGDLSRCRFVKFLLLLELYFQWRHSTNPPTWVLTPGG